MTSVNSDLVYATSTLSESTFDIIKLDLPSSLSNLSPAATYPSQRLTWYSPQVSFPRAHQHSHHHCRTYMLQSVTCYLL